MEFWLFLFIIYSLIVKGSLNLQDNSGQYVQHTLDPWNGIKMGGKGAPTGQGRATGVRKMPRRLGRVRGGKEEEEEWGRSPQAWLCALPTRAGGVAHGENK